MGVVQLLQIIWTGKWRVLLCMLAALAATMAVATRQPKAYEAKARVILELMQPDPVTGIHYNVKTTEPYVRTQQLLAMSSRVGERVVDKLGWATNPAVVASWQEQTGGNGDIRQWAGARVIGGAAAYPLEGGGTLEIAYRAPDPDAAETITRTIRESYIETSLALQNEAGARRAKRFETLLRDSRTALATAQAALITAQRETNTVVLPNGAEGNSSTYFSLQNQAVKTRLTTEKAAADAARRAASGKNITLRQRLIFIEQQIAQTDDRLGVDNPDYRALIEQRTLVLAQLAHSQAEARAAAGAVASAATRLGEIPEQAADVEQQRLYNNVPTNLRIEQAERLVKLRQGDVDRLERNLVDARQMAERSESGLVVMGDVIVNRTPVSPDIPIDALLAALFGAGLGLASVLIDGLAAREVLGARDLAGAAGVPVLAVLPSGRRTRWAWLRRLWPQRRGPVPA